MIISPGARIGAIAFGRLVDSVVAAENKLVEFAGKLTFDRRSRELVVSVSYINELQMNTQRRPQLDDSTGPKDTQMDTPEDNNEGSLEGEAEDEWVYTSVFEGGDTE